MMEDDMPGRVAGAVAHVEGELADPDLIAVVEPARRLEWAAVDPVLGTFDSQLLDPESILLVRALDRHAQLFGENAGAAAMVDMAVGQQDLIDRDARLARSRFEARQVAAGIDEGAAHRLGAPQQGAILL